LELRERFVGKLIFGSGGEQITDLKEEGYGRDMVLLCTVKREYIEKYGRVDKCRDRGLEHCVVISVEQLWNLNL
jgi:hypothetical protein